MPFPTTGCHVVCTYISHPGGNSAPVPILVWGRDVWTEVVASGATTANTALPSGASIGKPVFSIRAYEDGYYAIGSAPDASLTTGSGGSARKVIKSGDVVEVGVNPNDKLAWLAASAVVESFPSLIYASQYGVVAGTGADQGPALRTAILAAQAAKATLLLPPGIISVLPGTDADALLRIETLMSLQGSGGRGTRILPIEVAGNLVGSRDVLLIKPLASGGGIRGMFIRDLEIGAPGAAQTRLGRDAIRIDTTNLNGFVAKLLIENIASGRPVDGVTGYGLHHINTLAANMTGGLFGATIRNSDFWSGTKFVLTGDSNNIIENIITGPQIGIDYEAISGAAIHRIEGNNITAAGGALRLKSTYQVKVLRNQLEQNAVYTGTQNACIILDGAVQGEIRENNINGYSRVDCILATGGSSVFRIEGNVMLADTVGGKFHYTAVGSPLNSVGLNRYARADGQLVPRALSIDTASHPTRNVFQQMTLDAGGLWVAGADANFWQGLWVTLDDLNIVHMRGIITGGTMTAGTTITTLPAAYRPIAKSQRIATKLSGTPWTLGVLQVLVGGTVNIQQVGTNALMEFDDVSYAMDN